MKILCAATTCKYASDKEDSSNVVFISFPNSDISKIWAQNCERPDLLTKSNEEIHFNNYVCSHHLEDHYFISKEDPIIISEDAIPTVFTTKNTKETQTETTDINGLHSCIMNSEIDHYHELMTRLSKLCRICGDPLQEEIDIFGSQGVESKIKDKIDIHMPIVVDEDDVMPQKLCMDCYHKLEATHNLVITCLKTDLRFRRFLNIEGSHIYDMRFMKFAQECSMDIEHEMCTNNDYDSNKMDNDTGLKKTSMEQAEIGLANSTLQNVKLSTACENEAHSDLTSLFQEYKGNQNNSDKVLMDLVTQSEKNMMSKNDSCIVCVNCKETFKTYEIFENHKILCDESDGLEKHAFVTEINGSSKLSKFQKDCNAGNKTNEVEQTFEKNEICTPRKDGTISHDSSIQNKDDKNVQTVEDINKFEKIRKCGHCRAIYHTRKDLQAHMIECHDSRNLFMCGVCDKSYEKWSSLDIHEATHRLDKPYLCDLCGKSFKHSNNLRGHKRVHLDDAKKKRHVCDVCQKGFRSRFHLREHMNSHNDNRPYVCEECGKSFFKRVQLRQHKLSHGIKKYTCPICGATSNRRGNMKAHIKTHNKGDCMYTCSVCDTKCKTMSELKMHRKQHTDMDVTESIKKKATNKNVWQCKVCSRIFLKRTVLLCHEQTHSTNKMCIECKECGKKLSSKSSLAYHKRSIHSQERPHMCQFCGDAFVSKEARLIHERVHTDERPYACNLCNMRYRCSSNLSQHMKTHADSSPYVCQYCNKGFARRGTLTVHERIHTGVKPFPCAICGRCFSQKNDMLKHTKTHHPKSLTCEQCQDEVFTTKKELSKHLAMHMQETPKVPIVQSFVMVPQELDSYTWNIAHSEELNVIQNTQI